jgi:hypothetical protein
MLRIGQSNNTKIKYNNYRIAANRREDLIIKPGDDRENSCDRVLSSEL